MCSEHILKLLRAFLERDLDADDEYRDRHLRLNDRQRNLYSVLLRDDDGFRPEGDRLIEDVLQFLRRVLVVIGEAQALDDLRADVEERLLERHRIADGGDRHDALAFERLDVDALACDVAMPVLEVDEAARLMDALHDQRLLVVLSYRVLDVLARDADRLIDLRQKAHVGALDVRDRLSERAARQHVAVAEDIDRVDEQDVHVARKLPVLVAVVQDRDLRAEMLDRVLPRKRSLGADEHGHFGQMLGEHEGFVARLGRVHVELLPVGDNADVAAPLRTVAAVQDDDTIAHVADRRRQVLCSRRLARAADRDVAEADDVAGEMLALEKPRLIAPEL